MENEQFAYLLADYSPEQQHLIQAIMTATRNTGQARQQHSGRKQFQLENIHIQGLQQPIADTLSILDVAPASLTENTDWLHWELLVSEVSGRVEGMIVVDPIKVLTPLSGISDPRLIRSNPDIGKMVTVDMQRGITEITGDEIEPNHPGLTVGADGAVPYGLVFQCAVTLQDSQQTHFQIEDMGNIELSDALQACYRSIGNLYSQDAISCLAGHIIFMRALKRLTFSGYEYSELFNTLTSTYSGYFRRKKAHEDAMRNRSMRSQKQGVSASELELRALMTPEAISKAQDKLAFSIDKRGMPSETTVIDMVAYQQEQLNQQMNTMFAQDHPDDW